MENQKPNVKSATGMTLPILQGPPQHKDPVCGMTVAPEKAARKVQHAGETYYFCSKGCAERFEDERGKFLAAPGTAGMANRNAHAGTLAVSGAAEPASKLARYTCPMHPEVVQIGPGTCPICGMALEPMDVVPEEQSDPEYASMRWRFWVSAALSLPVLVVSMLGGLLGLHLSPSVRNLVEFFLATPVVLWGGWPFFQRFWASLVNRSPNMFTLIGLGTGAAYFDSAAAAIFPGWFPESFREMDAAP